MTNVRNQIKIKTNFICALSKEENVIFNLIIYLTTKVTSTKNYQEDTNRFYSLCNFDRKTQINFLCFKITSNMASYAFTRSHNL